MSLHSSMSCVTLIHVQWCIIYDLYTLLPATEISNTMFLLTGQFHLFLTRFVRHFRLRCPFDPCSWNVLTHPLPVHRFGASILLGEKAIVREWMLHILCWATFCWLALSKCSWGGFSSWLAASSAASWHEAMSTSRKVVTAFNHLL